MVQCYYDNPRTARREHWVDGRLESSWAASAQVGKLPGFEWIMGFTWTRFEPGRVVCGEPEARRLPRLKPVSGIYAWAVAADGIHYYGWTPALAWQAYRRAGGNYQRPEIPAYCGPYWPGTGWMPGRECCG